VGDREVQTLEVLVRHEGKALTKRLIECAFVPLLGKEGWTS